jgi:antitoxin component YwqK of YwqJK toxin-antitoxin module
MEVDFMAQLALLRVSLLVVFYTLFLGCNYKPKTQKLPELSIKLNQTTANFHQENGIIFNNTIPYSGYIFSLYPNSNDTLNIVGYLNGKEHGTWKQFYPNGKLIELRTFVNGNKEGKYIGWWEDGKKKFETNFKNGEYDGSYKEWNKAGQLILSLNYKNGYEDGTQQMFYDNGKIRSNYVIKNGRRYGLLGTKNCINVSDSIFKN